MKTNKDTILIVDDNDLNITILSEILSQYDLVVAMDGKTALEIVSEDTIDLILLDITMPDINGFDVAKILKNNPKTVEIPIVFLTAKLEITDIKYGFELGAIDYITKPFLAEELKIRVANHLELINYRKSLKSQVNKAIEENTIQEQILFQQSKQAEIGELMMHIAHQWKQPLSELGSVNTFLLGKIDMGEVISTEELQSDLNKNTQIISFMSETIETFQNFYSPNYNTEYFEVMEAIEYTLNIVRATFDYNNITIKINKNIKDDTTLYGNKNEFVQIILALLNNAKNIFFVRKIKQPIITFFIEIINKSISISITDNAGGIKLENNAEIFQPFISHSDSTGMGLYMANSICTKNDWKLNLVNDIMGAKFIILGKYNAR